MSPDGADEQEPESFTPLPGLDTVRWLFGAVKGGIEAVEREAVRRVRDHLEHLDGEAKDEADEPEAAEPGDVLAELVERGITQTATDARREHEDPLRPRGRGRHLARAGQHGVRRRIHFGGT